MKRMIAVLHLIFFIPQSAMAALTGEDIAWLDRITYGINQETAQDYEKLGRDGFLERQLHPPVHEVYAPEIYESLNRGYRTQQELMEDVIERRKAFYKKTKIPAKRSHFNLLLGREGNTVLEVSKGRHLARAIYSKWQLKEKMVWFWLNHFSVFSGKANIRWQAGDYEDNAIRPNAMGKFEDILYATMTHPAMLDYLDGSRNTKDKRNENYARELLELHTMGVNSGYTQKDITEVARLLTGVSANFSIVTPDFAKGNRPGFFRKNGVQFLPLSHDYGDKKILGSTIKGSGWGEVRELARLLAKQPATAKYISSKLVHFFIGDKPDAGLVRDMSERFLGSDGDIKETLKILFSSRAFEASLKKKFRSPIEVIVSTARLAYEDQYIINYKSPIRLLESLGQGLYARVTPDGYPMEENMWDGSSQLFSRFEAVRILSSGSGRFFQIGTEATKKGKVPIINNAFFNGTLRKHFSPSTLKVLEGLKDKPLLWNSMFFSSPEWMNREFNNG